MGIGILNSFFAVRYWRRQLEVKFQFDILIQIPTDLYFFISVKNETVTSDSLAKKRNGAHFHFFLPGFPHLCLCGYSLRSTLYFPPFAWRITFNIYSKLCEHCNNHLTSTPYSIGFIVFIVFFFAITSPVFLALGFPSQSVGI